ncbi:hypothetical protein HSX10_03010 [Winogradskyella undariae]|uniref:hypothetical protein n=1 Tax=Winogradskyella TaxID=286104 RepID=UPI00156B8620|nr:MULTISPECIES: hypothetical protein [Winogradskyella]NRR90527.1 hypothetical protein [Winogradskyella undariae]QXP79632.1 hypothetical protein H0I32_03030 [Winogradskyella sp. HaHa_3_26]
MKDKNLHHIKSTGLKTPDHYFESFETNFLDRLKEKKTFKGIENPGFELPNDYFDTVDNTILEKLKTDTETPVISLKTKRSFYYVAGIAASFLLFFSLVFNTKNNISFNSLDTAIIEGYLYQEEYTNEDFASLFVTEDISETDFIDLNISEETLDQYFENIEPEDLIFE